MAEIICGIISLIVGSIILNTVIEVTDSFVFWFGIFTFSAGVTIITMGLDSLRDD